MFSDFTPIKYILKVIEIVILYLALLFSGIGNTNAQEGSTAMKIDYYVEASSHLILRRCN